jgi:hypothetical protein
MDLDNVQRMKQAVYKAWRVIVVTVSG